MIEGLFATLTNVNFDPDSLNALAGRVRAEKHAALCRTVPSAPRPAAARATMIWQQLWGAQEDIRSLKSLLLFGSRGMAAYAYHAMVLGYRDETVERFLSKASVRRRRGLEHGGAAAARAEDWARSTCSCMRAAG